MLHKRHKNHVNTLCGELILRDLLANYRDKDILIEELLTCQAANLKNVEDTDIVTHWQSNDQLIQFRISKEIKQDEEYHLPLVGSV